MMMSPGMSPGPPAEASRRSFSASDGSRLPPSSRRQTLSFSDVSGRAVFDAAAPLLP